MLVLKNKKDSKHNLHAFNMLNENCTVNIYTVHSFMCIEIYDDKYQYVPIMKVVSSILLVKLFLRNLIQVANSIIKTQIREPQTPLPKKGGRISRNKYWSKLWQNSENTICVLSLLHVSTYQLPLPCRSYC